MPIHSSDRIYDVLIVFFSVISLKILNYLNLISDSLLSKVCYKREITCRYLLAIGYLIILLIKINVYEK